MTRSTLQRVSLTPEATLREVLECVDSSGLQVVLLVTRAGQLAGLLTDGDVRRAILAGADLTSPALRWATAAPQTVGAGSSRALVLDLMRALRISAVPEVDDEGRLIGLHTLSDVVGIDPLPNPVVVMAGGRGTRLGSLTKDTPKPLLEVAGRSILEWIVLNLVGGGIRDVYISVNHLAHQVEDHLGDGSRLGCRVTYLREDPDRPLGTAGSLSLLHELRPDLDVPAVVMNGDLMVQFEPARLLGFHRSRGAAITVATRLYQQEIPFGVVETGGDGCVRQMREKPTLALTVNAGVYAVSPEVIAEVPQGVACTMPDLVQRCLDRRRPVAAWGLESTWIDVGSPLDLARATGQL